MTITNDFQVFLNNCIKNNAIDYKILYENKCKECEELKKQADPENTIIMIDKLNEEYSDLYDKKEKLENDIFELKVKYDKLNSENKEVLDWLIEDKKYEYENDEDFIENYLSEIPEEIIENKQIKYVLKDTFGIVKITDEEIIEFKNEHYDITFISGMSDMYSNIDIRNMEEYLNDFAFESEFMLYCYEQGFIEECNDLIITDGAGGYTYWKTN